MNYPRLTHVNTKHNLPHMWFQMVDDSNPDWYYATIWGKDGCVNSSIHALSKGDYRVEEPAPVKEKKTKPVDDASEFM